MAYYSCSMIEQMYLTFSGRIDEDGSAISLCCESDEEIPKVPFAGTPEETLRSIVDKWNLVLTESKKYAITPPPVSEERYFVLFSMPSLSESRMEA